MEQALNRTTENEITNSIASFYQLKYGTSVPNLTRLDSTLRHATMGSSEFARSRIKQLSGTICVSSEMPMGGGGEGSQDSSSLPNTPYSSLKRPHSIINTQIISSTTQEEEQAVVNDDEFTGGEDFYEEMTSGGDHVTGGDESDNDDDAYTFMFQGKKNEERKEGGGGGEKDTSVRQSKALERAIKLSLSVLQPDKEQQNDTTTVFEKEAINDSIVNDKGGPINNDEKIGDNYDGDLYEECDVSSPRYIPAPVNG